jgi:hypothetical protein
MRLQIWLEALVGDDAQADIVGDPLVAASRSQSTHI